MRSQATRIDYILCGLLTTLKSADDVALSHFLRSPRCLMFISEAVHGCCTTLITFPVVQAVIRSIFVSSPHVLEGTDGTRSFQPTGRQHAVSPFVWLLTSAYPPLLRVR